MGASPPAASAHAARALSTTLLLATLLLATPGAAGAAAGGPAEPPELATLFPSRAPILLTDGGTAGAAGAAGTSPTAATAGNEGSGGRLVRLLLPPEVLGACRSDLSDLRILDAAGREVPYLVDAGRAPDTAVRVLERRTPAILGADRSTRDPDASGGTPALLTESYTLAAPPAAPAGQGWDLVLGTPRPRFVRSLVVTRAGGDEIVAEGSVFRLSPSSTDGGRRNGRGGARERLQIALPEKLPARLTVTLAGEEGTFLEPSFHYERSRRISGGDRARVPLNPVHGEDGEGSEDGGEAEAGPGAGTGSGPGSGQARQTVLEIERPRGLVPGALVLDTATAAFSRRVEVWDEGPGASDQPLGAATLYRVPAPSWMDAPIEERSIPIATPHGDRLRVVIDNGDSPPLDELAVRAALRRPALIFSPGSSAGFGDIGGAGPSPGDGAQVGTLLFGGGRAFHPRYDLQALLPALSPYGAAVEGQAAEIVERLVDPALLAEARLGAVVPNPRFDPRPALAFAHRPGAPVEARRFRYRRNLDVTPSDDGLARLTLSPGDLAHARADLADVRIVASTDTTGSDTGNPPQWAYLLEPAAAREQQALPVTRKDGDEPGTSVYELTLPATPVTLDRVILDSSAPFFDRPFTLQATVPAPTTGGAANGAPRRLGSDPPRDLLLASGRLQRRVGDPRPVTLAFPPTRIDHLELRVDDGSDAPLPIDRADARFPLPTLYFPVPEGHYTLLLGAPDATAPSYELTRARPLVLAVASAPADAGPLEDNPAYSRAAGLLTGHGPQRLLLWAALVAAVLVLGLFTLRLARREGEG